MISAVIISLFGVEIIGSEQFKNFPQMTQPISGRNVM